MFDSELLKTCDEIMKKPSPKNLEPPPSPSALRTSNNPESNIVITLSRKTSGSMSGRKGLSRKNTNDGVSDSSSEAVELRSSTGSTSSEPTKTSISVSNSTVILFYDNTQMLAALYDPHVKHFKLDLTINN